MDAKKIITLVLCSLIIAVGIIVGSAVSSSTLAERPLTGSFSGSLDSSEPVETEIMSTYSLMYDLGIFPSSESADYDAENERLKSELESDILSGKWPDFPYVSIDGEMYYSRTAVEEWFAEKGKTQLVIE